MVTGHARRGKTLRRFIQVHDVRVKKVALPPKSHATGRRRLRPTHVLTSVDCHYSAPLMTVPSPACRLNTLMTAHPPLSTLLQVGPIASPYYYGHTCLNPMTWNDFFRPTSPILHTRACYVYAIPSTPYMPPKKTNVRCSYRPSTSPTTSVTSLEKQENSDISGAQQQRPEARE